MRHNELPRVPLAPLARAVGKSHREMTYRLRPFGGPGEIVETVYTIEAGPIPAIAALAGVARRTVTRWAHIGIDLWTADRLACSVGMHPAELWADWFEIAPDGLPGEPLTVSHVRGRIPR